MRVLFWVPYPAEGASNRYRVEQFLPYLRNAGIRYLLHPFWGRTAFKVLYKRGYYLKKIYFFILGTISRLFDLIQIFRFDIVFIHREAYPIGGAIFETILSLLRKPFIFDFDDAIFLPVTSSANYFIEKFKKPEKVVKIIKLSSHVIVGNSYLYDFVLCYNHSVSIIPTSIDTDKYQLEPRERNDDVIIIGWIGSVTTVGFLNMIKDVFVQLSKNFNHIRFKIVGGNFSLNGLSNIINKQWALTEEISDLRTFDIGIMPMPDNEWTRGKCGFKAILYMSMGIPCVCSAIGVNKEIITDEVNGFLVKTNSEWIEKLSLLIKSQGLRSKIGVAGRKTIEEKYSVKVNAPKFLEIISSNIQKANR